MTLREAMRINEGAIWQNQDMARKNRIAAINVEVERIRQQITALNNRIAGLKAEKDRLQHPSVY